MKVIKVCFNIKPGTLTLLYSHEFDGEVLTRDAYVKVVKSMTHEDNTCHVAWPIDEAAAVDLLNGDSTKIITAEDIAG